jgi:hypothetical protein
MKRQRENLFSFVLFSKTGPVHTPYPPLGEGAGGQSESLPALNWDPLPRIGTLLDRPIQLHGLNP